MCVPEAYDEYEGGEEEEGNTPQHNVGEYLRNITVRNRNDRWLGLWERRSEQCQVCRGVGGGGGGQSEDCKVLLC